MNLHITSQNTALGVVSLRNSRAITCDIRLDGPFPSIRGLSRNLLRPELISTSLGIDFKVVSSILANIHHPAVKNQVLSLYALQ